MVWYSKPWLKQIPSCVHQKYPNGPSALSPIRAVCKSLRSNRSKAAFSSEQVSIPTSRGSGTSTGLEEREKLQPYGNIRWSTASCARDKTQRPFESVLLAGLVSKDPVQKLQYQHTYQRDIPSHSHATTPQDSRPGGQRHHHKQRRPPQRYHIHINITPPIHKATNFF